MKRKRKRKRMLCNTLALVTLLVQFLALVALAEDNMYYKLVNVAGINGCVEANVSSTTASAFGGKLGNCLSLGYTVPTGTQKIPFCCTVEGFKKP